MMRHFVAFSLLLFVLEISVEAYVYVPNYDLCFTFIGDSACRSRCLRKFNCRNGHCKNVPTINRKTCFCEDCPGGQKTKELSGF
ncbi:unnamed protein product [Cylicocyclus nassatus]|uniref:Uncharacterized protein n=1 Tax=Cylicocyclus nassatus TaxID=53992 RepID=A0AA36HBL2_CYLNA|nr:unnamed protein product [Cylicocyclus nassatus]